jgi:hypothetical protein
MLKIAIFLCFSNWETAILFTPQYSITQKYLLVKGVARTNQVNTL